MIPEKLSHYRVLDKIGAGGMGVVYRAHDEDLDRDVALKVLPAGTLADDNARQRFRREALSLARLSHPNIGVVFEFGSQDQIDFLVMELITGLSLDAKLAAGPMSESEVLRLGIQLSDGLESAHAQGIVHRDLKPGNLRLTADERLKILDFGLAQWNHPEGEAGLTATITRTQEVSGTVPYMAPEQLRGQRADVRSDIYAAGVVLYEMACGKRPFADVSGPQLIGAILERPPSPPSSHNHHISRALESIILKAIDKDPRLRYQSAKELRVDLERLSTGVFPVARTASPPWGWAVGLGMAVIVLLLFAFNVAGIRGRIFHLGTAPTSDNVPGSVKQRRAVAILGFKNLSGKPDQAWISTALAEMLSTELAVGEQVRTVPGESVARMKRDLELEDADSFGRDTLDRIHKRLGTDLLVSGSYLALGKEGGGKIRIDFRLQDVAAGDTIAAISETGDENELLDLISRTGEELRRKLGVGGLSTSQASGVRASLPSSPDAARLYSEGLEKLRLFEAMQAQNLLQKAVTLEPAHALSHSYLAEAWSSLGYDSKAQEEARKAFELSQDLSREDRLSVEGRYREVTGDWPKAIELYKTLWGFFPDNVEYGLRLASAQTTAGQGNDALATVEKMRHMAAPAGDDPRIDLAEANAAGSLSDFKREQAASAQAATKGIALGARLVVAQARLSEAWAFERQGQLDKALAAVNDGKDSFSAAGDRLGAASAIQMQANLLYDKGSYEDARRMFEDALKVYRDIGSQYNAARALNSIGNAFWEQGRLPEARDNYQRSLEIYRSISVKSGIAGALGNIANVLDSLGDLPGALKMHEESLQAFTDVGDRRGMASTYNNLGSVLSEMGKLDEAQERYEQGQELHRQTSHRRGEGYSFTGMGDIALARDDLKLARQRYEQALSLRKEIGEEGTGAQNLLGLAALDLEDHDPGAAEKLARQAMDVFAKNKTIELEATSNAILAQALVEQKQLPAARDASERALSLSHKTSSRPSQFDALLASARVSMASKQLAAASKAASEVLRDASRLEYMQYTLEARLLLAELELRSGNNASSLAHLKALETDAQARGFLLVARKASSLRRGASG